MTAEWITPKTDWKDGDYYQPEDAERFINNLKYLKELGEPCFPSQMYFIISRGEYQYSHKVYSTYNISFPSMTIKEQSDNPNYLFQYNLETLFKMVLLSRFYYTGDSSRKYPLHYNSSTDGYDDSTLCTYAYSSTNYHIFEGWYITSTSINENVPVYPVIEDLLVYAWNYVIGRLDLRKPFLSNRSMTISITSRNELDNKPFYTYTELGKIESLMDDVKSTFTMLRETYPRE